MARSSSYFGLRTGSTKSHTFAVLKGVQITKDRVLNVANPSTNAQRVQRVLLNTVAQAYSAMQEIVDHSWQGVAYGADTQAVFQSVNINAMRRRLSAAGENYGELKCFAPLRTPYLAPNEYVMSHGSIPAAHYSVASTLRIPYCETYEEACKAIGCKQGDQVTFCGFLMNPDGNYRFCYSRIIMQPQDEQGRNVPMSSLFFADDGLYVQLPNKKNEESEPLLLQTSDDGAWLELLADGEEFLCGCVIISRKHGKKWLRSSATMAMSPFVTGPTLNEAISTDNYSVTVQPQRYLNEAGAEENIVDANVTTVLVGGRPMQVGATYANPSPIVVQGSNITPEAVSILEGGRPLQPVNVSDHNITYIAQTATIVTVTVNGAMLGSFYIADEVPSIDVKYMIVGNAKSPVLGRVYSYSHGSRVSCLLTFNEWPAGGFVQNKLNMSNPLGNLTNVFIDQQELLVSFDINFVAAGFSAVIYDGLPLALFNIL